ncbi:14517_t:CDS:2 [Entrophospora sp. SA101]|nr:14517_t:CDS:2 [Entrophospora sp. SA101]
MSVCIKEANDEELIEQMVLYFKNNLNEFICVAKGHHPILPSKKNNTVGRVSNCFFQFKSVFNRFATSKSIPGHNNQTVLSKSQSMLWRQFSANEKEPFIQLYKIAQQLFNEKFPTYKYQPKRDKSILKVRSMGHKVHKRTSKKPKPTTATATPTTDTRHDPTVFEQQWDTFRRRFLRKTLHIINNRISIKQIEEASSSILQECNHKCELIFPYAIPEQRNQKSSNSINHGIQLRGVWRKFIQGQEKENDIYESKCTSCHKKCSFAKPGIYALI